MMGFGMGFGFIGLLFMILFWGGLILGGIWLVRTLFDNSPGTSTSIQKSSAREILDQRYARGEISREEYEQIKADL
jgi:putative membrane protein